VSLLPYPVFDPIENCYKKQNTQSLDFFKKSGFSRARSF